MTLESLLTGWKSLEIAKSFFRAIARRWAAEVADSKTLKVAGPLALKEAFFGEKVYLGQRVLLRGRLNQYCPIYFPIAYSPQAQINPAPNVWFGVYNPAPTAMHTRASTGDTLAFLYETSSEETPRIISRFHLDRTQSIATHTSDPSIPVILDSQSEHLLEQLVEIDGVITRLDPAIAGVIASSHEDMVRLYFHAFFRHDFYPVQGFVLDARATSQAKVSPLNEIAPFATSLAIEARYQTARFENEIEEVLTTAIRHASAYGAGPSHYQPAYYTPGGYRVVQLSQAGLIVHVAPELGVVNISTMIDTLNPDRRRISEEFLPAARKIIDAMKEADPEMRLMRLFASNEDFFARVGIAGKGPTQA